MMLPLKPTNMVRFFLFVITMSTFSVLQAETQRLVFLGDSLTAGYRLDEDQAYPALVGDLLDAEGFEVEVVNAGVSGDTSAGGMRRINWLVRQGIDILIIALGANDALRGLDADNTRRQLQGIVDTVAESRPEADILLAGMLAPPNMGEAYQQRFAAIYADLAAHNDIEHLPFLLEGVAGERNLNLSDGVHPNAEGHKIVAANVAAALKPMLNKRLGNAP